MGISASQEEKRMHCVSSDKRFRFLGLINLSITEMEKLTAPQTPHWSPLLMKSREYGLALSDICASDAVVSVRVRFLLVDLVCGAVFPARRTL